MPVTSGPFHLVNFSGKIFTAGIRRGRRGCYSQHSDTMRKNPGLFELARAELFANPLELAPAKGFMTPSRHWDQDSRCIIDMLSAFLSSPAITATASHLQGMR